MLESLNRCIQFDRLPAEMLVDSLIVVALYFFGRVNRKVLELQRKSGEHDIEWRDAERAVAIVEHRGSIESLVRSLAQSV